MRLMFMEMCRMVSVAEAFSDVMSNGRRFRSGGRVRI